MIHRYRRLTPGRTRVPSWLLSRAAVILISFACASHGVAQRQAPAPALIHSPSHSAVSAPTIAPPYDVSTRSQAILAHLNAALRFYRDSEAPIQRIGEPSDLYYRNQAVAQAAQAADYAFQSAKVEVGLMARSPQAQSPNQTNGHTQRLQQSLNNARQRIAELKMQDAELDRQIASAPMKSRARLQQQLQEVDGELELQSEMADALSRIAGIGDDPMHGGFAGQVAQLERSAPGVAANKATSVAPTLESIGETRSLGVFGQARAVFGLLHTMQSIRNLTIESGKLRNQAIGLRAPLITSLKQTIAQGQALSRNAAASQSAAFSGKSADDPANAAQIGEQFKGLSAAFKVLSAAAVPLSQEILTLEQTEAGLQAWDTAVDQEYDSLLQTLLLRVLFIAIALGIILIVSELWRRGTKRYVRDLRRRRQLLVLRRFVVGFLVGVVLIFGLVTQFSSLATFAGLITAGIAVGLQTVLLSIAAYFFIVGRYGIKAGDRISIAGVTGDVVEVGLLRFYVMEMAGAGTDSYSTGRIAVFSNAVLFQATTPLYKQMPGTEFAWHEIVVKLAPDANYRPVAEAMLKAIGDVYCGYRGKIEQQHKKLEAWMDSSMEAPAVHSSLRLADEGPQLSARYPVIIRQAGAIDAMMTESLLKAIDGDEQVKSAISGPPVIRAIVHR